MVSGSKNSQQRLVSWAAAEIHGLRLACQADKHPDVMAGEGDLARLGALMNQGMVTRGKPEGWSKATEFRHAVKQQMVSLILGLGELETTKQLTAHEARTLANYLARKESWDLNESGFRFLDCLESIARSIVIDRGKGRPAAS